MSAFFDERLADAGLSPDADDRALLALDLNLNAQGLAVAAARKRKG